MIKKQIVWGVWAPQRQVVWPLLTYLSGFILFYVGTQFTDMAGAQAMQWIVSAFFILIPAYYTLMVRRRNIESLGVTDVQWPQALGTGVVVGLLIGLVQISRTLDMGHRLSVPALDLTLAAVTVPLVLVVAGEELLLRGWFQSVLEPAFGFLPALLLASLAYALLPLALSVGQVTRPMPFLPAGYMPPPPAGLFVLFFVGLLLNIVYRLTGNLWSSGMANFLARFALIFAWAPADLIGTSPALTIAVALALWAVVILSIRRWMQPMPAHGTK